MIGTLGGVASGASDVNDHGQIVGYSKMRRAGSHAFIYENGQLRDLNDLCDTDGAVLSEANAINNDGDIVGQMKPKRPNNTPRGYLLRPAK